MKNANREHAMEEIIYEIERRLSLASKGPWKLVPAGASRIDDLPLQRYETTCEDESILTHDNREVVGTSEWIRWRKEDAEFIAHSREDIELLLAEVKRLRAGGNSK